MRPRVEFRLTMPRVGSWNGRWSGEGRNYTIVRTFGKREVERLGLSETGERSWSYSWSDGWAARVTARILPPGTRAKKSDGFCGYDWMVRSIVLWGEIRTEAPAKEATAHA